jgi:tetratricopeptide (TPR) repeat protein/class 3 adenylate cyclase/tRNA A-37 threonylcarbamoyl transferase component Bud32
VAFSLSNEHRASMEEFRRRQRSGILVLLFTDLVESTQLKQDVGDQQAVIIIRQHHAIIRELLKGFAEGKEIDTAGDSFFIVFVKPSDGVKFALLVQAAMRRLAAEVGQKLALRIGLHAGEVFIEEHPESRKPMDLYGIQVDSSARVMSLAQGNQILLTRFVFDNARQLLKGEEIASVGALSWLNHGPYLMKGVEEPMEICEVGELGSALLARPLDSEKARRHISVDTEPVLGWRPAVGQAVPNTGWVLERKLGAGGFGEVWLGRHEKLKERRVFKFCFHADRVRSLKREVTLFRLLKERGNHPNIVGIQDVFFDEPPFYIMMDYADGEDLGKWAEKQGGLDKVLLAARLEIVAQVADALQAAHEAGIIHRDVKPSNIIVCGSSAEALQVKLTDFGIGQVVSKDVLAGVTQMGFTQTMSGSSDTGTPMYKAPELLGGKPASTRSDIYSLGVVLYQLLVGDLTRPLTMDWEKDIENLLLREDLAKCLAGNPQERFAAAQELAHQVRTLPERRLELSRHEAEIAAKVQAAHRAGVMRATAVAMGVIVLMAGLTIWAIHQSSVAKREAARAEANAKQAKTAQQTAEKRQAEAEAITKFMTEVFQSPDPARDGRTITVAETLGAAAKKLETQLTNDPERRARLRFTIGLTYFALGLYPEAISLQEKARDYYLTTFGPENADTLTATRDVAASYDHAGRRAEALRMYEQLLKDRRKVRDPENADTIDAMSDVATSYEEAGRLVEAIKLFEEVLSLSRKVNGPEHIHNLKAMDNLAVAYSDAGRRDEALKIREQVLPLHRKLSGSESRATIDAMGNLAISYQEAGRREEALKLFQEVLELRRKVLGPENPDTLMAANNLANSNYEAGHHDEALKLLEEVLALRRKVSGPEHPDTLMAMNNLAVFLDDAGRRDEALKLREDTFALRRKVSGPEHPETLKAMNNLAVSYDEAGRKEEALKLIEDSLTIRRKVSGTEHPETLRAMDNLAYCYAEAGRRDEALKLREEALALYLKLAGPQHPATLAAKSNVADSYDQAGRRDEALKLREEVLAQFRKASGPDHPETLQAMNQLAISYDEAGRKDEALTLREEVLTFRRKVLGQEHPDTLEAMNVLARMLAASDSALIRNGTNAVHLAEEAVAATHRQNPGFLDTLAAAYAETQQFDKAVAAEKDAMALAKSEPDRKDYASRLILYQANKPYRAQATP